MESMVEEHLDADETVIIDQQRLDSIEIKEEKKELELYQKLDLDDEEELLETYIPQVKSTIFEPISKYHIRETIT